MTKKSSFIAKVIIALNYRFAFNWLPDAAYLKLIYRARVGKRLNLKDPQTFNEKLQWLKLYDRKPEYTKIIEG